jgi:hypothetical protein
VLQLRPRRLPGRVHGGGVASAVRRLNGRPRRTNKEIGARLFISERTVDGHVRNILDRLGFDSRTQIAAWVASSEERSRPD